MKTTIAETVERTAKTLAKRETQTFPAGASVGDCVRQGDVYVTLLAGVPDGFKRQVKWDRQLAHGSTQGSRHILDSRKGAACYAAPDEFTGGTAGFTGGTAGFTGGTAGFTGGTAGCTGPVLVLKQTRELTHPEHGNWSLPPGTYGISYQRTQDALDRQRRVVD